MSSFDQDGFIEDTPSDITVQAVVPPYWQHRRYESYASVNVTRPPPITLEDHTQDLPECKSPLWAKGVLVNGYVMISGGIPSVGDYIVWNCTIDTLDVSIASSAVDGTSIAFRVHVLVTHTLPGR